MIEVRLIDEAALINEAETGGWDVDVSELRMILKYVPTIDAVPVVRGKWIQHHETTTDNETLPYGWECSLCGRWEMEKQPFCNCSAKMEDKL